MDDARELQAIEAANAEVASALHAQREAVVAARLAGRTWAEIARSLGVSRQAATERFLCHEQVAKAWQQVEQRLSQLAGNKTPAPSPMVIVQELSDQGLLHPLDVRAARELQDARNRSVHQRDLTPAEAEHVTEQAIPLIGNLYRLAVNTG